MNENTKHAIVLGGGFAGILAAKALARHFAKVTVIERDPKKATGQYVPREGVPQGGYAHLLLPVGERAVVKLFPEYREAVVKNGARRVDLFQEVEIRSLSEAMPRFPSEDHTHICSRVLIEETLRELLAKESNVEIVYNTETFGLIADFKNNRVTGARVRDRATQKETNLYADFVVSAMGPRSHSLEWLEGLGYPKPPQTTARLEYVQVAWRARWDEKYDPSWLYSIVRSPSLHIGGYFMRIEDDPQRKPQWLVAVVTHFGEPLQGTREDFQRVLEALGCKEIIEAINHAEELTPLQRFALPAPRFNHFIACQSLPEGLICMGDEQAVWAPHTGLGLATAALEASKLAEILETTSTNQLSRVYYAEAEKLIQARWYQFIDIDVRTIGGEPVKSYFIKFFLWYKKKISKYSANDPVLWKEMLRYILSDRGVGELLHPATVARVLWHLARGK